MDLSNFKKRKVSQSERKQYILTGAVNRDQYEFVKNNEISIGRLLRKIIDELMKESQSKQ